MSSASRFASRSRRKSGIRSSAAEVVDFCGVSPLRGSSCWSFWLGNRRRSFDSGRFEIFFERRWTKEHVQLITTPLFNMLLACPRYLVAAGSRFRSSTERLDGWRRRRAWLHRVAANRWNRTYRKARYVESGGWNPKLQATFVARGGAPEIQLPFDSLALS